MQPTDTATSRDTYDVVVVGAGFAGLYALRTVRALGLSVVVLEAGTGVGGTWFWNRYPGARCDVESVDYSFSFDEALEDDWVWTERYATQPELLRYAEHVAARFDLVRDIRFRTRLESAEYDERAMRWNLTTDAGGEISARFCVMASGCLSAAKVPALPGLADFEGEWLHPGAWPEQDGPGLRGKRVGVIGTGSTGVQIISTLAPEVEQLTVFQRTPHYTVPARNAALPAEALDAIKREYAVRRDRSRRSRRGFPLPPEATERSIFDFDPAEQRERLERMWARGGSVFTSTFGDLGVDRDANGIAADFVREKIRETVADPVTAERLCPTDYPLGGKRPCVGSDYYETYNRENVELVSLRETPIRRFVAGGVQVADREIPLDVVIFATGYDAITGSLDAIDIRGRGGATLKDHWATGAMAYLGLCSAGFPNMFFITGPGSPSVLTNMVLAIEQHIDLMRDVLVYASGLGAATVEADADAEILWGEHVATLAGKTLLVEADSWYLGANIPGKPRAFMPYPGGMAAFADECRSVEQAGFAGFAFEAYGLDRAVAADRGTTG